VTRLVVTRGLPGSGKTTRARDWLADGPNRVRVNRDVLREHVWGLSMAPGEQVLNAAGEASVTALEEAMVGCLLTGGWSVVVDDTCLRDEYLARWVAIAGEAGAVLEVWDLRPGAPDGVSVDECVRRDANRAVFGDRYVGEQVIRQMARDGRPTWDAPKEPADA
jgi:predicted kinase